MRARDSDGDQAGATYRRVLDGIHTTLADQAPGRPVALDTLALQRFGDPFDQEARVRARRPRGLLYWLRSLVVKLSVTVGRVLMRRRNNAFGLPDGEYREAVIANTDFRKFDDTLRMVLDLSSAQCRSIETMLEGEHAKGNLCYGLHLATTSLMTCAISDYRTEHMHFVDGSDGGYALAAKQLKEQLAALDD